MLVERRAIGIKERGPAARHSSDANGKRCKKATKETCREKAITVQRDRRVAAGRRDACYNLREGARRRNYAIWEKPCDRKQGFSHRGTTEEPSELMGRKDEKVRRGEEGNRRIGNRFGANGAKRYRSRRLKKRRPKTEKRG